MNKEHSETNAGYKIGVVARMTGISPDTLRIWERRYAGITPVRTSAGDRLFSADEVARLRLIKQLVDKGDSIGAVAALPMPALESRVNEVFARSSGYSDAGRTSPMRLVVVGEAMRDGITALAETLETVELVASYESSQSFANRLVGEAADIVIIEQPTLLSKHVDDITGWLAQSSVSHAVIVYRYSNDKVVGKLPSSRCSTLRAPVEAHTLIEHCASVVWGSPKAQTSEHEIIADQSGPAPPRRFDDRSLAQLGRISSAIKCECPRHLAELIASLNAFEQYSLECESSSRRDAALHAHLNKTASHARHMSEDALEKVIEAEGISLSSP